MTLGLNTQPPTDESEFLPTMRYLTSAGRLYRRDRVGGAAGFTNDDVELPPGTKIVFDFGSIQIGWMLFGTGVAPSFALAPVGHPMPERPTPEHRQGVRLLVHLGKSGGLREFCNNSKFALAAIDDLHTQYEADPEAATGKIPVVEFTGATKIDTTNRHGTRTDYRPNFTIVQWIPRVSEFGERTVPPPSGHAPSSGNGAARSTLPPHRPPGVTAASPPARQSVQQRAAQLPQQPVGGGMGGVDDDDLNDTIPFGPCWQ